jgi:acetyl esterase/lipase
MSRRLSVCLGLVGLMYLAASCGRGLAQSKAAAPADVPPERMYEVEAHRELAYYDGPDADKVRHKLDLYVPKGVKDFPVVLFVHGGGWMLFDKNGVHAEVGKMFARHGIGAAVTNYRLSPKVQHPEHVKDVARAFAWVHKHVPEYGGRPDELFVCGHSAGGHLAALLATDESYLKAEGLSLKDVKGAMPLSGVYSLPDGLFNEVFGKDPAKRREAWPMNHVGAGCPPFLIVYADHDFPFCDIGSEQFGKALKGKDVPAETLQIKERNHLDIIGKTTHDDDPCARALRDFIRKHVDK